MTVCPILKKIAGLPLMGDRERQGKEKDNKKLEEGKEKEEQRKRKKGIEKDMER